jgi:hypothetical protein
MTQYKEVSLGGGDTTFVKPKDMTKGQTFEGTLKKVLTSEYGPTFILETTDGDIGINSSGKLTRLMEHVSPGSQLRIVYNGKTRIEKGQNKGKDAHDFKVFVADAAPTPLNKVKKSA